MKKYELKTKAYLATEKDSKIKEIADKLGIILPSEDLAIFITKYAALEEANLNGVRLATDAVEKSLKTLNGKLVDCDHIRSYIFGSILDSWINTETGEIEICFSMYKSVFIDEYTQALELLSNGELSVSFELTTQPDTIEDMKDGTIRLHDINFSGVGLLLNTKPAYPKAKIYEMANRLLNKIKDTNLVFASQIAEELGSNAIAEIENIDAAKWTTKYINSLPNSSFAVIEPDYLNNKTENKNARHLPFKDENGTVDLPHLRNALARVNQIQPVTNSISTDELRSKGQATLDKYRHLLDTQKKGGDAIMELTEEQKKQIVISEEKVKVVAQPFDPNYQDTTTPDVPSTTVREETIKVTDTVDPNNNTETVKVETTCIITKDNMEIQNTKNVQETIYTYAQVEAIKAELKSEIVILESAMPPEVLKRMKELIKQGIAPKDAVKQAWDEYKKKHASEDNEEIQLLKARIKELEDAATAKEVAQEATKKAEKIASIKAELKDNPYTKEFKDEDFLNEAKVEQVKILKERDDLKAENETLKKTAKVEVTASDEVKLVTGHEELKQENKDDARSIINKLGKD